MTETQVRKSGKPALIATMAMEDVSRAYEKGETKGFMKILVDRESKQILGASLLGLSGDEVIHCILDLMYAKAPYTVLQRAMHIHPTVSEFIQRCWRICSRCNDRGLSQTKWQARRVTRCKRGSGSCMRVGACLRRECCRKLDKDGSRCSAQACNEVKTPRISGCAPLSERQWHSR
jgi:hypothetical protein